MKLAVIILIGLIAICFMLYAFICLYEADDTNNEILFEITEDELMEELIERNY